MRGLTDAVTQAANEKKRLIEEARKLRTEILNRAAGAQYRSLLNLIDAYGAAQATGADADRLTGLRRKIDAKLEQAGGQVSLVLQVAKSDRTDTIERMQRDSEAFTPRLAHHPLAPGTPRGAKGSRVNPAPRARGAHGFRRSGAGL